MLLRRFVLLAMLSVVSSDASAQAPPENEAASAPVETVSVSQSNPESKRPPETAAAGESTNAIATSPETREPFRLPRQHHPWARFQPGAWRQTQTMTATLDETGNIVGQNFSTQKETLDAVADGKFVLKVQATVDVGGKQIVGDEKIRALHLETDGAGSLSETIRLDDLSLSVAGRQLDCERWDIVYQQGDRGLRDAIHYCASQFPYVVKRQTFSANSKLTKNTAADVEVEEDEVENPDQIVEVVALETPYTLNDQVLNCTCIRTLRQRAKGGSVRIKWICREIPGGEVQVQTTEFDAQGRSLRFSETTLLDFGGAVVCQEPVADSVDASTTSAETAEP